MPDCVKGYEWGRRRLYGVKFSFASPTSIILLWLLEEDGEGVIISPAL